MIKKAEVLNWLSRDISTVLLPVTMLKKHEWDVLLQHKHIEGVFLHKSLDIFSYIHFISQLVLEVPDVGEIWWAQQRWTYAICSYKSPQIYIHISNLIQFMLPINDEVKVDLKKVKESLFDHTCINLNYWCCQPIAVFSDCFELLGDIVCMMWDIKPWIALLSDHAKLWSRKWRGFSVYLNDVDNIFLSLRLLLSQLLP